MKMRLGLLICFVCAFRLCATDYYASPTATAGAGTANDPFSLSVALTNSVITAGDTLILQSGTYQGPGFLCTLSGTPSNYVTVRGAVRAGNHDVVLNDANCVGVLLTNLDASAFEAVKISHSELWHGGGVIVVDYEQMQLQVKHGTNWTIVRGWNGTTAASHSSGAAVFYNTIILSQTGTNCAFRDLEVTSVMTTNRNLGNPATNVNSSGIDLHGSGNKVVNCIIHNTGHPGIGFWSQGAGGEVNGCLIFGVGQYNYEVAAIAGSAIYSQNVGGTAKIRGCINFRNFTSAGKVFGETGGVKDFKFEHNVAMRSTDVSLEIASGSTAVSNVWMDGNFMLGTPLLSYVSRSNRAEYFINNVLVNGSFSLSETTDSALTNNLVLMATNSGAGSMAMNYQQTSYAKAQLNLVWDYNSYYIGRGSSSGQWGFYSTDLPYPTARNSFGGGILDFVDGTNSWSAWSGFDTHTLYGTNWPNTNIVNARNTDYDDNIIHVAVVCTTGATNAQCDPGTNGWHFGDTIELRDAQNVFTVLSTFNYANAPIDLPLNLTNVSTINGTLTHMTNEHTNVRYPGLFNAFVLTRIASNATMAGSGSFNGTIR